MLEQILQDVVKGGVPNVIAIMDRDAIHLDDFAPMGTTSQFQAYDYPMAYLGHDFSH